MGKLARNTGKEPAHEGWSVHAVTKPGARPVQTPDQGHPIRRKAVIGAGELAENRFMAAHSDDLSVGKIQCETTGLSSPSEALIAERIVIGYEQGCAEDLEGGHRA